MNNGYNRKPSKQNDINERRAQQRALYEEERRRRKAVRDKKISIFFQKAISVAVFSLIGLAICLCALFIFINFDFNKKSADSSCPVVIESPLIFDEELEIDKTEYSYRNGEHYISLSVLTEHFDTRLTGDVKHMTLSFSDTDSATFSVGSNAVNINGSYISLKNPTYFSEGRLFVPQSFFEGYVTDAKVVFSGRGSGRKLIITLPEQLYFVCKSTPLSERVEKIDGVHYENTMFTTDLSEYEQYMNPEDKDEYLFLVNAQNSLASDFVPDDLVDVKNTRSDRAYQKMRLAAAMSLEAMFKEMYAAGYTDVSVTSGYRSYDYQATLFNNEVALNRPKYGDNAEEVAATAITRPGTSEHQSGLCADLHNLSAASTAFASEDAYKWLYSHCADFGFILRYPKDKTDITGIMFEPWHYRFVGRYHAQKIMQKGLCLEEYMAEYNG